MSCFVSAHSIQAALILGDRLYSVTIQRIFDRLRFVEKCKMVFLVIWEALTMSLFKIKDYIKKTEDDDDFVKGELERFAKHMPSFAEVPTPTPTVVLKVLVEWFPGALCSRLLPHRTARSVSFE